MTSPLSAIPVDRRRQLAATLGLFAVLFVAVGAVAATGGSATVVRAFSAIALVVAVLLGLIAWGVLRSVRIDLADADLDARISAALAAEGGGLSCDCGHDHDVDELHVGAPVDACSAGGPDCTHTCDTCVLAALRPSPTRSRAERLAQ